MKRNDDDVPIDPQAAKERARRLGLHGLVAHWDEVVDKRWLDELLELEEKERSKRSLDRRIRHAKIGAFKSMADFDWTWPKTIDKDALEEVFGLGFVADGSNVVLLGPNGVGKTMMIRNLAQQADLRGHAVCFTTASDMLSDLVLSPPFPAGSESDFAHAA